MKINKIIKSRQFPQNMAVLLLQYGHLDPFSCKASEVESPSASSLNKQGLGFTDNIQFS